MRYFVDPARRLVRTEEDEGLPTSFYELAGWKLVTSQEWDEFRKETAKIAPKKLREMRKQVPQ